MTAILFIYFQRNVKCCNGGTENALEQIKKRKLKNALKHIKRGTRFDLICKNKKKSRINDKQLYSYYRNEFGYFNFILKMEN